MMSADLPVGGEAAHSPPAAAPVFRARGAGKQFGGERNSAPMRALEPFDLDVLPGEFVTLIGPSGCGKSTLLRLLAGLAAPSEGELRWWGGGCDAVGAAGSRIRTTHVMTVTYMTNA